MHYQRSSNLFKEAQKFIPGGVNSPVRAFKSVGGTPIFIEKANGALLYDADGNSYLDYISMLHNDVILNSFYISYNSIISESFLTFKKLLSIFCKLILHLNRSVSFRITTTK